MRVWFDAMPDSVADEIDEYALELRFVADPAEGIDAAHIFVTERDALEAIRKWGWIDLFRRHHPEGGHFSWWDYRAGGFRRNHGMRIDHILVSQALKDRVAACWIDKTPRKNERPSDHAPVVLTLS